MKPFFHFLLYMTLEADRFRVTSLREGGIGFLVLRFWPFLDRFFGFVPKNFGFSVLVFIAVGGFSVFKHLVFGFREKY